MKQLREIRHRLKAPTPRFWRKVQKRCALAAAGLAVALGSGFLPEILLPAGKYLFAILSTAVLVAQLTCDDAPAREPAA